MRFIITLLLIAANLITFGLIWKVGHDRKHPASDDAPFLSADIRKVEIIGGTDVPVPYTLERKNINADWKIMAPFFWDADFRAVEEILNALRFQNLDDSRTVDELKAEGNTLKNYGLETPKVKLRIEINGTDGTNGEEISIGKNETGTVFFLVNDRIFRSTDTTLKQLTKPLRDIQLPFVFSLSPHEVNEINIVELLSNGTAKTRVTLKRTQETIPNSTDKEIGWRFEMPVNARASKEQVSAQLRALAELRYENVEPEKNKTLKDYELDENAVLENDTAGKRPAMRITLAGATRTQAVLIGKKNDTGNYYAKRTDSDIVFTVAAGVIDSWNDAAAKFRERHFLYFHKEELTEIEINKGQETLKLSLISAEKENGKKKNDTWRILPMPGTTATNAMDVDPEICENLIAALHNLSAKEFFDGDTIPPNLNFTKPTVSVKLMLANNAKLALLIINDTAKKKIFAKLENAPAVYEITPEILKKLSTNAADFQKRIIEKLPETAKITSVKIETFPEKKILHDTAGKPQESWDGAILKLIALPELRTLKARKICENDFRENFSINFLDANATDTFRYELTFAFTNTNGTDETRTLLLTRRLGGSTQIAGSKTANCIFEIEQPLIDALHPLLFDANRAAEIPEIENPQNLPPPPTLK